jgi:DNA modification methylase
MHRGVKAQSRSGPGVEASRFSRFPLAIVYHRVADLHLDPANARVHSKKQIRQIAHSIETFGFNVPVLVDGDLKVIAGHGRLLACRELGWTEVPTISLAHLSEAQVRAFMIADNRLTEIATWNDRLLGEQLRELSALNLDFSLDVTGFDIPDIDVLIEGIAPQPDNDDAVPRPQSGLAVCRPGDLWHLGPHRIYCGSAIEESSYQALMGSELASGVFTDPPYNVPIAGHASGLGSIQHREFAMASGEMNERAFTGFLAQTCDLLARYSHEGSLHYLCMDWRHAGELLAAAKRVYAEQKNLCVWAKDNAGMGSFYRSQHELVFVFKHGRAPHRNNVQLGKHGRNRSNLWSYPGARSLSRASEEGNLLALHPTVKPVRLVADALLDSTARGEIVLDAFLGSGTTLIAAERVRRRCYAQEIDPLYVDTAIRRWQAYTGEAARHGLSGRAFDDLDREAQAANGC